MAKKTAKKKATKRNRTPKAPQIRYSWAADSDFIFTDADLRDETSDGDIIHVWQHVGTKKVKNTFELV